MDTIFKRLVVLTIGLILLQLFLSYQYITALAQSSSWSTPNAIFQTPGWTFNVQIIDDTDGNLVALWQYNPYKKLGAELSRSINANDSLFVSRLVGDQWSNPVEVLIGEIASERLAVVVDHGLNLHVFSHSSCLWHATVIMSQIDRPQAWSEPTCIADLGHTWPAAVVSDDGRIYVVYSNSSAQVINYIFSDDDGISWSYPSTIVESVERDKGVSHLALAIDHKGELHLIWTEVPLPSGYPPLGIVYSRSIKAISEWTNPITLSGSHQGQGTIIVDDLNRLHVVWNGDASDHGRYYTQSVDLGYSWVPVVELLKGNGGSQLPPGLVVDSTGSLHVIVTDQERLMYFTLDEQGWSSPIELLGPQTQPDISKLGEIDSTQISIVHGNELHAIYTRYAFGQVLHQFTTLNLPHVTEQIISTPIIEITDQPNISQEPISFENKPEMPVSETSTSPAAFFTSPNIPILSSLIIVIILIALISAIKFGGGRNN